MVNIEQARNIGQHRLDMLASFALSVETRAVKHITRDDALSGYVHSRGICFNKFIFRLLFSCRRNLRKVKCSVPKCVSFIFFYSLFR